VRGQEQGRKDRRGDEDSCCQPPCQLDRPWVRKTLAPDKREERHRSLLKHNTGVSDHQVRPIMSKASLTNDYHNREG